MKLYLVQHGVSLPEEVDPDKGLNEKGREETLKMAEFLQPQEIKLDQIWHSKKKRSIQTANIFVEKLLVNKLIERSDLNPLDSLKQFPSEIEKIVKNLMVVGHLPFLQKLASLLLTGDEDAGIVTFKNSSVVCLEYDNGWKLLWAIIPDLLQ